jgi:hypothetical protein
MLTFRDLRLSSLAGLALALSLTPVLAQSGGGSTGGAGAATGASSGTGASGMDAAGSGSRALRQQGTGGSRAGTPGTAAPNPALGSNTGQSAAPSANAGTSEPTASDRGTEQSDLKAPLDAPQKNQSDAGATNRGGTSGQPPNVQAQPGQQRDSLTTGGSSRREGAAGHDMQSCMEAWDARTHMTKAQWRRVCTNTLSNRRGL